MFRRTIIYISVVFVFTACVSSGDTSDKPLARVGDKTLMLSDVQAIIPADIKGDDSIMLVEDYIKKWIISELVVAKAEENLSASMKNFTKEIEDYRNSMLTYRYKKQLMLEQLDTAVTQKEIQEYYELNKKNHVLNHPIAKGVFMKMPLETAELEIVPPFCNHIDSIHPREIKEFCTKYTVVSDIFVDKWVELEYLKNKIPPEFVNEKRSVKKNYKLEVRDDDYYYFLRIFDFLPANEIAPVEYIAERIKSLIINKRRVDFLRNIEEEIYKEGIKYSKFKLYDYDFEQNE